MPCQHLYSDPRLSCRHPVVGATGRCLWHNAAVAKDQSYVAALFLRADGEVDGDWNEAHLAGITLSHATLTGRRLVKADLRNAVLDGADLTTAVLTGANLRRASLRRANLAGADLRGTDLTGANLTGADLRGARLSDALLDGTALHGADLRGADLDGARVIDFRWNRLTRFAGVRGLEPADDHRDGDTTQIMLLPVAMGEDDLDSAARLAQDPDGDLGRTRIFRPGRLPGLAPQPIPEPPPPPVLPAPRRPGLLIPVIAALLAGGMGMGLAAAWFQRPTDPLAPRLSVAEQSLRSIEQQLAAERSEREAGETAARAVAGELATARAALAASASERGRLSEALLEREAELGRLRDASDRATVLAVEKSELAVLNRDLAGASARQDQLSRILADGVDRYRADSIRLAADLEQTRARARLLEETQTDLARTKAALMATKQELAALTDLYQGARQDLLTAKTDIERYLGRIQSTQFQGLLTDDAGAQLHRLTMGKPLSLGGDFLVSLSVDKADPTATVSRSLSVKLIVQRPAAAANPDATVVLYDAEQKPLRRLSYSFPHVDDGAPFMAASATIACDRQPAFARLILAPGAETTAGR